jgi:methyl-accepting chemotaxis protein
MSSNDKQAGLSQAIHTMFKKQHGISINDLNSHIEIIPKLFNNDFGQNVDKNNKQCKNKSRTIKDIDKENTKIMKKW